MTLRFIVWLRELQFECDFPGKQRNIKTHKRVLGLRSSLVLTVIRLLDWVVSQSKFDSSV